MQNLETKLLGSLTERMASIPISSPLVSFHYYGRAGAFRQHLNPMAHELKQQYSVITFSDTPDTESENSVQLILQSLPSSGQNRFQQLAISSRFWRCAAPEVPKLTCLHVLYDYDPFERAKDIAQPHQHYIFASSRPSFEQLKKEIIAGDYQNDVVIIPGGYPRLDRNRELFSRYHGAIDTLIYAPTASMWEVKDSHLSYSLFHGRQILQALDKAFPEHRIVFRPHPTDLSCLAAGKTASAASALQAAIDYCRTSRCELERGGTSYMESYSRSAVMISDTSSTAFTFALTTLRPVVFYAPGNAELIEKYSHFHSIRDRECYGQCVDNVDDLVKSVHSMLSAQPAFREKITRQSANVLFHEGQSAHYFHKTVDTIVNGGSLPEWWRLKDR